MSSKVVAVSKSGNHNFNKNNEESIQLVEGLGVEGDAHSGVTVQHLSRVRQNPNQPNLRQVHLIHSELHAELKQKGFEVGYGDMGENITTQGIDLLNLPTNTRLKIGAMAVVEITGLRNPCAQLDAFQSGLMAAVLDHDADGNLIRKAGVMGIVIAGGEVRPEDVIEIVLPPLPHQPLKPV